MIRKTLKDRRIIMATKVKNLNGTSDNDCPKCGTWLKHWEKLSGKTADECACCSQKATVGAHVQKAESDNNKWYIVPLCKKCNGKSSTEEFNVYEVLASAVKC